jgi:hypothetical protein
MTTSERSSANFWKASFQVAAHFAIASVPTAIGVGEGGAVDGVADGLGSGSPPPHAANEAATARLSTGAASLRPITTLPGSGRRPSRR